jgi:hypothetical protein
VKQFTTNAQTLTAQKMELAQRCLAANCIEVPKDATDEAKMEAAMKLSHQDLFKAYNGAVNAAVARTGVTFAEIPSALPSTPAQKKEEPKGRAGFIKSLRIQGYGTAPA